MERKQEKSENEIENLKKKDKPKKFILFEITKRK